VKKKRKLILNYLFRLQDLHVDPDSITCKKNHKTKGNREGVRVSYSQTWAIILPIASLSVIDQA
jgi:hypothetical protein